MDDCTQILDDDFLQTQIINEHEQVAYILIQDTQYPIFTGVNVIGRGLPSSIIIDHKTLSKEHAAIEINDFETHFIYDKGSRNKTRLSKVTLKPQIRYQLQNKSKILFGDLEATYYILDRYNKNTSFISEEQKEFSITDDEIFKKPDPFRSDSPLSTSLLENMDEIYSEQLLDDKIDDKNLTNKCGDEQNNSLGEEIEKQILSDHEENSKKETHNKGGNEKEDLLSGEETDPEGVYDLLTEKSKNLTKKKDQKVNEKIQDMATDKESDKYIKINDESEKINQEDICELTTQKESEITHNKDLIEKKDDELRNESDPEAINKVAIQKATQMEKEEGIQGMTTQKDKELHIENKTHDESDPEDNLFKNIEYSYETEQKKINESGDETDPEDTYKMSNQRATELPDPEDIHEMATQKAKELGFKNKTKSGDETDPEDNLLKKIESGYETQDKKIYEIATQKATELDSSSSRKEFNESEDICLIATEKAKEIPIETITRHDGSVDETDREGIYDLATQKATELHHFNDLPKKNMPKSFDESGSEIYEMATQKATELSPNKSNKEIALQELFQNKSYKTVDESDNETDQEDICLIPTQIAKELPIDNKTHDGSGDETDPEDIYLIPTQIAKELPIENKTRHEGSGDETDPEDICLIATQKAKELPIDNKTHDGSGDETDPDDIYTIPTQIAKELPIESKTHDDNKTRHDGSGDETDPEGIHEMATQKAKELPFDNKTHDGSGDETDPEDIYLIPTQRAKELPIENKTRHDGSGDKSDPEGIHEMATQKATELKQNMNHKTVDPFEIATDLEDICELATQKATEISQTKIVKSNDQIEKSIFEMATQKATELPQSKIAKAQDDEKDIFETSVEIALDDNSFKIIDESGEETDTEGIYEIETQKATEVPQSKTNKFILESRNGANLKSICEMETQKATESTTSTEITHFKKPNEVLLKSLPSTSKTQEILYTDSPNKIKKPGQRNLLKNTNPGKKSEAEKEPFNHELLNNSIENKQRYNDDSFNDELSNVATQQMNEEYLQILNKNKEIRPPYSQDSSFNDEFAIAETQPMTEEFDQVLKKRNSFLMSTPKSKDSLQNMQKWLSSDRHCPGQFKPELSALSTEKSLPINLENSADSPIISQQMKTRSRTRKALEIPLDIDKGNENLPKKRGRPKRNANAKKPQTEENEQKNSNSNQEKTEQINETPWLKRSGRGKKILESVNPKPSTSKTTSHLSEEENSNKNERRIKRIDSPMIDINQQKEDSIESKKKKRTSHLTEIEEENEATPRGRGKKTVTPSIDTNTSSKQSKEDSIEAVNTRRKKQTSVSSEENEVTTRGRGRKRIDSPNILIKQPEEDSIKAVNTRRKKQTSVSSEENEVAPRGKGKRTVAPSIDLKTSSKQSKEDSLESKNNKRTPHLTEIEEEVTPRGRGKRTVTPNIDTNTSSKKQKEGSIEAVNTRRKKQISVSSEENEETPRGRGRKRIDSPSIDSKTSKQSKEDSVESKNNKRTPHLTGIEEEVTPRGRGKRTVTPSIDTNTSSKKQKEGSIEAVNTRKRKYLQNQAN